MNKTGIFLYKLNISNNYQNEKYHLFENKDTTLPIKTSTNKVEGLKTVHMCINLDCYCILHKQFIVREIGSDQISKNDDIIWRGSNISGSISVMTVCAQNGSPSNKLGFICTWK